MYSVPLKGRETKQVCFHQVVHSSSAYQETRQGLVQAGSYGSWMAGTQALEPLPVVSHNAHHQEAGLDLNPATLIWNAGVPNSHLTTETDTLFLCFFPLRMFFIDLLMCAMLYAAYWSYWWN